MRTRYQPRNTQPRKKAVNVQAIQAEMRRRFLESDDCKEFAKIVSRTMLVYTVAIDQMQQMTEYIAKRGFTIGTIGRRIAEFNKVADQLQEEMVTLVEDCSPGTAKEHHRMFGEDFETLKNHIDNL